MTCGRERGTRAESEKSKSPKRSRRIVRLVSPIPISNASAPDQVSPPDIIMNASKDDLCFGNSEKIKVVYEEDVVSEVSTVPYISSPKYHPGSPTTVETVCHTPEISDIRPNPLSEVRWSDSDEDF